MHRGNKNHNHRARGGGRGHGRSRGRGRGGSHHGVPTASTSSTAAANRAPHHPYPHPNVEIDVVIQQWPEPSTVDVPVYPTSADGGGNVNKGSGPWRSWMPKSRSRAGTPLRGTDSPRRGTSTQRGRGRGRGRGQRRGGVPDGYGDPFSAPYRPRPGVGGKAKKILGTDASLSDLLYAERPLLRPVTFVRATLTPFLFQHSEEVLKPVAEVTDTAKVSHVPTADRVAQLFHENRIASDSDSDSEGHAEDAIEEIDFADMAKVRAEVDAIAQSTITTKADKDVLSGDIEEVDFADLAALRATVDAAGPQTTSLEDTIQEAFTGVYNHTNDTTRISCVAGTVHDGQPSAAQQMASSESYEIHDALNLESSVDISHLSNLESGTIVAEDEAVDEEAPCSSDTLLNIPVEETSPSPSRIQETHILSQPDDCSHPLFIVDAAPIPLTPGHSASDVIHFDRAGHGETLGDQDEERIVYVAPHPRSTRALPSFSVPRAELPQTSMLTGVPVDLEMRGPKSPISERDADPAMSNIDRTRVEPEAETGDDQHLSLASLTIEPTTSITSAAFIAPPTQPEQMKAEARMRKKETRIRRQRDRQNKRGRTGLRAYGEMMSEARLWEEDAHERRHPRWATKRRGDSDVDWGTEGEGEDEEQEKDLDSMDAESDCLGGMEIDPDLELDTDAMQGFLKSMSAEGSRFVTMDDIEDKGRMQREDEEGLGGPDGSSDSECSDEEVGDDDEEDVFNAQEDILIAESDGDEENSEDSDDDELSPGSSFQARLRKMRERTRTQPPRSETVQEMSDEENADPKFLPWTRSANDEAFIAHINDLIEENSQILYGHDRKQKNTFFRHLHEGYVDVQALQDDPEFTTPVNQKKKMKSKGKQPAMVYHNAELEAQWAKDRAKKAAQKQGRHTARLLAALDPLSAEGSGRTRASRKAMRAAARLDPDAKRAIAPHAIVDMASLEEQMRRFALGIEGTDVGADSDAGVVPSTVGGKNNNRSGNGNGNENGKSGGKGKESENNKDAARRPKNTLALPPMDKLMRKRVHELATIFGIKSVSKGQGAARYTTLIRTTKTGVGINEGRIKAVMKRYGEKVGREYKSKEGRIPRHREGDEVGKEAPKISENNIGFRMLASMGWQEGDRIGGTASVGIEAPLTAIIKNSKLGLGATR